MKVRIFQGNTLGYLLVAVIAFLFSSIAVTYVLAVTSNHVYPVWPYISYTGNHPIESCIFSMALNSSSAVLVLLVILRYLQILEVTSKAGFSEERMKKTTSHNRASLILGLLGTMGLSVTGSFQQNVFHSVHICGAIVCGLSIEGYNVYQTVFSFTLLSDRTNVRVRKLRVVLVVFAWMVSIAIPLVHLCYSVKGQDGVLSKWSWTAVTEIRQDEKKNITSALEWLLFILNLVAFSTYYPDLKKVSLNKDHIWFLE